ncbi:MAG: apolipoprotein N-acyltransferase [Burkholderiaceae bacterium]
MIPAFAPFHRLRLVFPLALLAGGVNVFSFAPFHWWPIQILALAFLFLALAAQSSVKRSILIAWAFSFAWLAAGIHWLYISMHRYGNLPSWMAALAVVLLAAALALFVGLMMGLATRLRLRHAVSLPLTMLVLLPCCWLLAEWLRGWVLTGFPWIASGYAHTASPLAGFAPLVGVYGIAGLAAILAGCLALLPQKKSVALYTLLILAAGIALKNMDWTKPHGQTISVRLLQGNIPQEMKFAQDQILNTLTLYHDLIRAQPADLIATPETALPLLSRQLPPDYLPRIAQFSADSKSHIALGIAVSDGPHQYANSLIGFSPNTDGQAYRYDKHHLVPFGEFIPAGARWFVDMMRIPLGDFTRGDTLQHPFAVKDQLVLPNICYEDLFGEEIANQLAAAYFSDAMPATVLLNVSNIAWFGDSVALPQHLQISQMRALETGRPMLRATNTGATAVIDPKGKVQAQLEPFTRGVLASSVQGYSGWTPYMLFGNTPVIVLALAGLAFISFRVRFKRRKSL